MGQEIFNKTPNEANPEIPKRRPAGGRGLFFDQGSARFYKDYFSKTKNLRRD